MSKLLRSFFRPTDNNKNNNNNNFTLKAPRLNRSLNTLRKKSKETLKRKKNRGRSINSPMYPYGSNQNFESSSYLHETNNPLVQHTLGRKLYTACIDEKYDIAQRLIDEIIETDKTQLDYIGENGTPLIVVATSIHRQVEAADRADPSYNIKEGIQLIKNLIEAGANIEIHNHKFATNSSVISLLVDVHNVMDLVPLYDIIRLLLDKGANLNIINDDGHTTLDVANHGPSDLAGEIIAKGGRTSQELTPQLFESCLTLREKALPTISVIDKEKLGRNLLRECIEHYPNTPLILTHISQGADLELEGADIYRDGSSIDRTPLLSLCSKMYIRTEDREECDKLAVILIKAGANIDTLDRSGQNALMYSIQSRYYDTPRVLIEHGANLNIVLKREDFKDSTALDLAMVQSYIAGNDLIYAKRKVWADSLVKLIKDKGGHTAKELRAVVNWKPNPMRVAEPRQVMNPMRVAEPRQVTNSSTRVMNPIQGITNKRQREIFNPMQIKGGGYRRKTRKLLKNTRR